MVSERLPEGKVLCNNEKKLKLYEAVGFVEEIEVITKRN